MPDDEEPLSAWYARREARRRPIGERRVVSLQAGPNRGSHVDPQAPRIVQEWDGHSWQPVSVADDYSAACRVVSALDAAVAVPVPGFNPLGPRTGRHRKIPT